MVWYQEEETFVLAGDDLLQDALLKRSRSVKTLVMDESSGATIKIADTDGDVTISMAGVTEGQFLFVESSGLVDVKINGVDSGLQLKPTTEAPKASLKLVAGSFTSLVLSNPTAASTIDVTTKIAGVQ